MEITVNSEPINVSCATLLDLIQERNLDTEVVIIEHNLKVITRNSWATTQINHGDTIELLSFVGGG